MPDAPEIVLTIGGTEFEGWQAIEITRSLETLAAGAQFSLSDVWVPEDEPHRIREFDRCEVAVDGEPMLSGYITSVAAGYDGRRQSVSVAALSMTGLLAKSAADLRTGELIGQSLDAAARKLTAVHGITVRSDVAAANTPFGRIEIEPGETVAELLERLARQRGVFLTDNPEGELRITRPVPGRVQAVLEYGARGGILACDARFDGSDQHSEVAVKGQREGSDDWSVEAAAQPVGRARDASVGLRCPLVLISETQGDAAALTQRAEYEVALRRGRARVWTYTVADWRTEQGALWVSGEAVEVTDKWTGLERDTLLVIGTAFILDDDGARTVLTLAPPEGYELRGIPEKKPERSGW